MKKLFTKLKKYLAITYVNIKNSTAYKSEFFFIGVRNIIVILIFINFFSLTFQASGVSQFDDLNLEQILWLLILIRMIGIDWSVETLINQEIRSGDLAYSAARPYSYILSHYASFYGRRLPQFFFGDFFSNLIPALLLIGKINVSLTSLIAFIPLIILGVTLEFLFQVIIGLCTFWIDDVTALKWIFHKIQMILGGTLIPIAMFPKNIQLITQFLPFRSIYYNPAKVLVSYNFDLFLNTLLVQLLWLIVIGLITFLIFKKGMKNVSLSGG